ncbi:MAG: hypothetical protein ACM3XM_16595 [Mycobacterium leprae]
MDGLEIGLAYSIGQVNRFAVPGLTELWVCSAHLSQAGAAGIAPLLDSARQLKAVIGAGPMTDPAAVRALLARGVDLRLFPYFPDAEFHLRCYMGRLKSGRAWAAVNLADAEPLTTVCGKADHPFFRDLSDWLLEVQSYALLPTVDLLHAVAEMYAVYQSVAAGMDSSLPDGASWQKGLQHAREFISQLHQEALCRYVAETQLVASDKLVILGLLLSAPEGRLALSECARRFQAFYCGLQAGGLQPERSTGNPPPLMRHPLACPPEVVEQLVYDARRTAFRNTNRVVIYQEGPHGTELAIARPLWSASTEETRRTAYLRLLDRLELYYEVHVGSAIGVRRMMDLASGTVWPDR